MRNLCRHTDTPNAFSACAPKHNCIPFIVSLSIAILSETDTCCFVLLTSSVVNIMSALAYAR